MKGLRKKTKDELLEIIHLLSTAIDDYQFCHATMDLKYRHMEIKDPEFSNDVKENLVKMKLWGNH